MPLSLTTYGLKIGLHNILKHSYSDYETHGLPCRLWHYQVYLKSEWEINFFVSTVTFATVDFTPVKTVIQKSVFNNCWRSYLSPLVHIDENFSPSMGTTREIERAFEKRAMREKERDQKHRDKEYFAMGNVTIWEIRVSSPATMINDFITRRRTFW